MLREESYGRFLRLINEEAGQSENEGEEGEMTYGDVMILLTQYKSALAKYNRKRF